MADFPEYTIRPDVTRLVIPSLLITILLAVIFYAGIAVNIALLGIKIPKSINILIFTILMLLVAIQTLLTYLQASKTQYFVYKNRIQTAKEYFMFNSIQELKQKRNFLDKMLGTGTLILGPKTKIKAIPNFEQTMSYLRQLVQYSRTQYNAI